MRILLVLGLGLLIWIIGVWTYQNGYVTNFVPANNSGLTEIFFEDHEELPSRLDDREHTVTVLLVNGFNEMKEYDLTLNIWGGGYEEAFSNRSVELEPNESRQIDLSYQLPGEVVDKNNRLRVEVFVDNQSQLHFWLEPVEISDAEVELE